MRNDLQSLKGNQFIFNLIVLLSGFLIVGLSAVPVGADDSCVPCHGTITDIHGSLDHTAVPGSGEVAIFADTDHDDAGHIGDKPYFGVDVNCEKCHNTDLPKVHGNDCATCHPTPYDTLGTWDKGCQQGGCHVEIHQEIFPSHYPFEDAYDQNNDCTICHGTNWWPTDDDCLKCHAKFVAGDTSPPITTAKDVQAEYIGTAKIDFSIKDNGKVGVGRTFYQLNGGPETAAGKYLIVSDPGTQELKFWSWDQSGNVETTPTTVIFNIVVDNTPPVTTSNAQSSYTQGGQIILTATDDSTQGVKQTYFRLNGGPTQTGNVVNLPTTPGTISYTLEFWSEDYAGNVETPKSVSFTITSIASGNGILRLSWGDSVDTGSSPCPYDPEAWANWTITKGGFNGTVIAEGSGSCNDSTDPSNWTGVDDISVPLSMTGYYIRVDWWYSDYGYDDQTDFSNIMITTPGQVEVLRY